MGHYYLLEEETSKTNTTYPVRFVVFALRYLWNGKIPSSTIEVAGEEEEEEETDRQQQQRQLLRRDSKATNNNICDFRWRYWLLASSAVNSPY